MPEPEPAPPVHCAVPYIQPPSFPDTESGLSETAPLWILLPKHQVKLPLVCRINRETVLKTSPYKMRESYYSFVRFWGFFFDLSEDRGCSVCSST